MAMSFRWHWMTWVTLGDLETWWLGDLGTLWLEWLGWLGIFGELGDLTWLGWFGNFRGLRGPWMTCWGTTCLLFCTLVTGKHESIPATALCLVSYLSAAYMPSLLSKLGTSFVVSCLASCSWRECIIFARCATVTGPSFWSHLSFNCCRSLEFPFTRTYSQLLLADNDKGVLHSW